MFPDTRDVIGRSTLRQTAARSSLGRFAGAALALSTLLFGAEANAAVIAQAAAVVPAATGELGGARVTILQGAQLEEGQLIVTDAGGEVQVTFIDNTRMVIGPNSSLQIERFLMRNDGTFSTFAVNALGGTFRFISGSSPSDAYQVSTPAGTISVRGTKWDLTVNPITGLVNAMVYQGSIILCPYGVARCVILRDECDLGTMAANTAATIMEALRSRERFANATFPYAVFQAALLLPNQIENAEECADEEEEGAGGGGGGGGSSSSGSSSSDGPNGPRPNDCPSYIYWGKSEFEWRKFDLRWASETKGGKSGYSHCYTD